MNLAWFVDAHWPRSAAVPAVCRPCGSHDVCPWSGPVGNRFEAEGHRFAMAPKLAMAALVLSAFVLAGCTSGSDNGDGSGTTTSGEVGVGGTVSGPGGGVGGNATLSGSATMTNTTTNGTNGTSGSMAEEVTIANSQYSPSDVTVMVGGTVTWVHSDGSTSHTVTADDGSFDSSPNCAPSVGPLPPTGDCLTQGETYTVTFSQAGDYTYHCKIHGGMTGTVRVVEA
jgi:plastocyanin